tara:strand:+ start:815 stop:1255 length:441 start_codon:yes stop_codon:yes gene_type:complete
MNLSASIVIERPIEEVFSFISRIENMPRWVTGVAAARLDSPEMTTGASFRVSYSQGFRADTVVMEVITFEPPRIFETRSSRAPFQFAGSLILEEYESGTLITNTIEADADSLSTRLATLMLGPFLARSMQKRLHRELRSLNRAIGS